MERLFLRFTCCWSECWHECNDWLALFRLNPNKETKAQRLFVVRSSVEIDSNATNFDRISTFTVVEKFSFRILIDTFYMRILLVVSYKQWEWRDLSYASSFRSSCPGRYLHVSLNELSAFVVVEAETWTQVREMGVRPLAYLFALCVTHRSQWGIPMDSTGSRSKGEIVGVRRSKVRCSM